jgi:hypothetical protein
VRLATVLVPFGLAAIASHAHAETEQAVSVGVGYATYAALGKAMGNMPPPTITPTAGAGVRLGYERALSQELSMRGAVAAGGFVGGGTAHYGEAAVGVTFRFDVLKYVPYAFAEIGLLQRGGGPLSTGLDPVLCLGGGLDVLASRSRSWGFEAQLSSFGGSTTVFTIGLRGTHRWGFF